MTEEFNFGEVELSDDLKALDAELSSIRYEERPSFGPELRAELARVWAEEGGVRPASGFRRNLIAAGLAALLVGGAAVPSARASFVRLIGVLSQQSVEVERPAEPLPAPAEALVDEGAPVVVAVEEEPALMAMPAAVVSEEPTVATVPVLVAPEMIDRARAERLLQDAYPMQLQRAGVGGTVWLRLWIDETGLPSDARISRTSGISELDETALEVAPRFSFLPALQDGRRLGTWIQFPVLFEPDPALAERELPPAVDPMSLPTVPRAHWWQMSEPLDLAALPSEAEMSAAQAGARVAAEASLEDVLGDPAIVRSYGPARSILAGEAPEGVPPTEWRAAVGGALEAAIAGGTANPAALLAFGRIRIRQGLRTEARLLFERGLEMAVREEVEVSPWVVAELHHERAALIRETWLASNAVGRVKAEVFSTVTCAQARSSGGSGNGFASAERLIAWNYLCPAELSRVFANGFETTYSGSSADLTLMMASYRAAIEAYPGHVGANTGLLLTLASVGRWRDVLAGARRFTRVSGGHANGLLIAGLALHRLDESAEALDHFEAALERMPDDVAAALSTVEPLLDRAGENWYRRLPSDERRAWDVEFWNGKDPVAETAVNERRVEHLARTTWAQLRFGDVFGDAGEVWVRFGGPDTIHIIDEGSGRLTEFWDYGAGPDITFVRWVSSKRTDLTPEGRAYVDDLGKIFPPQ